MAASAEQKASRKQQEGERASRADAQASQRSEEAKKDKKQRRRATSRKEGKQETKEEEKEQRKRATSKEEEPPAGPEITPGAGGMLRVGKKVKEVEVR